MMTDKLRRRVAYLAIMLWSAELLRALVLLAPPDKLILLERDIAPLVSSYISWSRGIAVAGCSLAFVALFGQQVFAAAMLAASALLYLIPWFPASALKHIGIFDRYRLAVETAERHGAEFVFYFGEVFLPLGFATVLAGAIFLLISAAAVWWRSSLT